MRSRELLELHAIVKGKVQGVGFRVAVKAFSEQLNLIGFVRNLSDGSVEIIAQGQKSALEQLLEKLRQKFRSSIHEMVCDFQFPTQTFFDFKIQS